MNQRMKKNKKLLQKWSKPNSVGLCVGSLDITDLYDIIVGIDNKDLKRRCLSMLSVLTEFVIECRPHLESNQRSLIVCIKGLEDSL